MNGLCPKKKKKKRKKEIKIKKEKKEKKIRDCPIFRTDLQIHTTFGLQLITAERWR